MIVIVDYKMGNSLSIKNMLKKIGTDSCISSDVDKIQKADKLILPGVGAFDTAMANIKVLGLMDVLNHQVLVEKKPVLGICLGMQLMCNASEEGSVKGFGWVNAEVIRFPKEINDKKLRIPHIGWNSVKVKKSNSIIAASEDIRFYFVHSYFVQANNFSDVLTETDYGITFCSAFKCENVTGVQFHPEKSHKFGMNLFKKFVSDN